MARTQDGSCGAVHCSNAEGWEGQACCCLSVSSSFGEQGRCHLPLGAAYIFSHPSSRLGEQPPALQLLVLCDADWRPERLCTQGFQRAAPFPALSTGAVLHQAQTLPGKPYRQVQVGFDCTGTNFPVSLSTSPPGGQHSILTSIPLMQLCYDASLDG